MTQRLLRNIAGLLGWLTGDVILLFLNCLIILSNYMSIEQGFALLGYSAKPLGVDPLAGWLTMAFFHRATLGQLYSLGMAMALAVGLYIVCYLTHKTLEMILERRRYLQAHDERSAELLKPHIIRNIVILGTIFPPLLTVIIWDWNLFCFRSLLNAMGVEDPSVASNYIERWDTATVSSFSRWLARMGATVYLAVSCLGVLSLEYCSQRTREYCTRFVSCLEELLSPEEGPNYEESPYMHSQNGGLGYGPQGGFDQPMNPPNLGGDGLGVNNDATPEGAHFGRGETTGVSDSPSEDPVAPQAEHEQNRPAAHLSVMQEDGTQADRRTKPQVSSEIRQKKEENEVVGRTTGKRVKISEAAGKKKRFWVDSDSKQIWEKKFRSELLADLERKPER